MTRAAGRDREDREGASGLTGERWFVDGGSRARWRRRSFVLGWPDGVSNGSGCSSFFPASDSRSCGGALRLSWNGEEGVRVA
jgi:hypothetical protein